MNLFDESMTKHLEVVEVVSRQLGPEVAKVAQAITEAYRRGNKVLIMGNGGSAADAQHFAAELVGRFLLERKALPAIALTTDSSILTAVGNDYGFENIFVRQIEALANPDDIVFGISTSGHSVNVFKGLTSAQKIGCRTIGLLGRDGGSMLKTCDQSIVVQVNETPRIQEMHLLIIHILCDMIEKQLFASNE
jgi:D-sedoheptulose 7-phosphate isomerase